MTAPEPDPGAAGGLTVTVVGIGEDGWDGLPPASRQALAGADVVLGGARQVELVRGHVAGVATWPTDLAAAVAALPATHAGRAVAVLASGDPMFHGVGVTVRRELPGAAVTVLPHPSSVALAAARLGWASADVAVVSAVAHPVEAVLPALHPRARVLVLTTGPDGADRVAACLAGAGWTARLTVLARLGGPAEAVHPHRPGVAHDPLAVVAVECDGPPPPAWGRAPGLPDAAFATDGTVTKSEVRALTVCALRPAPGAVLWDVGAGSGSVAVEWVRAAPGARAVAVEPRADRCALVAENARRLGAPGVEVVRGSAPAALAGLARPDAVFVGGGATVPGVLAAARSALPAGGRLVVNAVTVETEAVLLAARAAHGGTLRRVDVGHHAAVGGFHAFRPALPVTQWVLVA